MFSVLISDPGGKMESCSIFFVKNEIQFVLTTQTLKIGTPKRYKRLLVRLAHTRGMACADQGTDGALHTMTAAPDSASVR